MASSSLSEPELDQAIRQLVSSAVADSPVPPDVESFHRMEGQGSARWRRMSLVAGLLLIVAGGIVALAAAPSGDDDPDLRPVGSAELVDGTTSPTAPATEPPSSVATSTTASTTTESPREPVVGDPIAVLDESAGMGVPNTPSEADAWVWQAPSGGRAVRENADGSLTHVSWSPFPLADWEAMSAAEPVVEIDGFQIARTEMGSDTVRYAAPLGESLFTATLSTDDERQLAQWFADVLATESDQIGAPTGFVALPAVTGVRSAIYAGDVIVNTITFEAPATARWYAAADLAQPTLEPTSREDQFLIPAIGGDTDRAVIVWQARPDIIVSMLVPADRADELATHLRLGGTETEQLSRNAGPIDAGTPVFQILGETRDGRFAFTRTDQPCKSFTHFAYGGGGYCGNEIEERPDVSCGAGWSPPDHHRLHAFAVADEPPAVSFTIDGDPIVPRVESGTAEDTSWYFYSAVVSGYPVDAAVEISINGDNAC